VFVLFSWINGKEKVRKKERERERERERKRERRREREKEREREREREREKRKKELTFSLLDLQFMIDNGNLKSKKVWEAKLPLYFTKPTSQENV